VCRPVTVIACSGHSRTPRSSALSAPSWPNTTTNGPKDAATSHWTSWPAPASPPSPDTKGSDSHPDPGAQRLTIEDHAPAVAHRARSLAPDIAVHRLFITSLMLSILGCGYRRARTPALTSRVSGCTMCARRHFAATSPQVRRPIPVCVQGRKCVELVRGRSGEPCELTSIATPSAGSLTTQRQRRLR
jgi:hypothetical protein